MKEIVYNKQKYTIYTKEEFGKEVHKLKDVDIGDEWVLTEDGWVVPILKLSKFRNLTVVKTPLGQFTHKGYLHTDRKKCRYGSGNTDYITSKQKRFAFVYAKTQDPVAAYLDAYNPNPNLSKDTLRKHAYMILKKEKVRKLVDEYTKEALDKLHVSREWVFGKLKELVENAESEQVVLGALKEFIDVMEIKQKTKESGKIEIPLSREELQLLQEAKRKKLTEPVGVTEYEVLDNDGNGEVGNSETDVYGHISVRKDNPTASHNKESAEIPQRDIQGS